MAPGYDGEAMLLAAKDLLDLDPNRSKLGYANDYRDSYDGSDNHRKLSDSG